MAEALQGAMALLIAVAGWFYMFYSKAADDLGGVESDNLNRRRICLRKAGGVSMLLLAVCFYAGTRIDELKSPLSWLLLWTGVVVLLLAIVVLGLIDLRLTYRLRSRPKELDKK